MSDPQAIYNVPLMPPIPSGGVSGSTGSGSFSPSTILGDLNGNYVGLPTSSGSSSSGIDFGTGGWSTGNDPLSILGDLSSMGTVMGNPTSIDSAIGTTSGSSNANTYENPGGTLSNNPGSPGGAGTGSSPSWWTAITGNLFNIFAVVLGLVFVIIGAVGMAKTAGASIPAIE